MDRICGAVRDGTGLVVIHSAHHSKVLCRLMGTSCDLTWWESGDRDRIWVVEPSHPIAAGLDECIELPRTETYGSPAVGMAGHPVGLRADLPVVAPAVYWTGVLGFVGVRKGIRQRYSTNATSGWRPPRCRRR